jgi:predicted dehydrogenase
MPPLRFGLTGLGGYAGYACDRLLAESQPGQRGSDGSAAGSTAGAAKLVAVCEPELERFPRRVEELRGKGVAVVRDYADLLDHPIDAVWLPLPIDLHLSYTQTALKSGKAVLCEKPAAGCVDDVDRMIAARDAAHLPVAIGFQDVYQPAVAVLKDRLLKGEFGKPLRARVIGCWPRSERYFNRNAWAGKFRRGADGCWIMDSPASNALAHFLHLALFLLGPTRDRSANVTEVAAELYRANRIENYDTCSMRFVVGAGVPLLVAYTHACAQPHEPVVSIETERGQIRYVAGGRIEIRMGKSSHANGDGNGNRRGHANGDGVCDNIPEVPEVLRLSSNPYKHMFGAFRAWARDGVDGVLGSTLEMARAHVVAVNAASEAAPIADVPEKFVDVISTADQSQLRAIHDIVAALESCVRDQCLLHETGHAPWSYPPVRTPVNGYAHFAGPAKFAVEPVVSARTFIAQGASMNSNVADTADVPPLAI